MLDECTAHSLRKRSTGSVARSLKFSRTADRLTSTSAGPMFQNECDQNRRRTTVMGSDCTRILIPRLGSPMLYSEDLTS